MGKKGGRKKNKGRNTKQKHKSKGQGKGKGNRLNLGGNGFRGNNREGIVVANAITHSDLIRLEQSSKAKFGLYTNLQRILLVGEGNFTFAAALATRLGGDNICATSLDSRKQVLDKYGDIAKQALRTLDSANATVLHGIDATNAADFERLCKVSDPKLVNPLKGHGFDRVIFNFPHCGGATEEDVKTNRNMLQGFFTNSRCILKKDGEIHVTLRDTPFYKSWAIEELAKDQFLQLLRMESVKYLQEFVDLGYQEARTNPATRAAPTTENALTYIFSLLNEESNKTFVESPMKKRKGDDIGKRMKRQKQYLPKSTKS